MTAINLTLGSKAAWLASDTLWVPVLSGPAPQVKVALTAEENDRNLARSLSETRFGSPIYARKLVASGGAKVAAGATGDPWPLNLFFAEMVNNEPPGVEELMEMAPSRLRVLTQQHAATATAGRNGEAWEPSFVVFLAGWSRRQERPLAWQIASELDCEPVPLGPGHYFCPDPNPTPAETSALMPMFEAAKEGERIFDFHLGVMRSQARASREGAYCAGKLLVGGRCVLAEVNAEIVGLADIGSLDDSNAPYGLNRHEGSSGIALAA